MPLALNGYEIGVLTVALVFIAFALIVALVVPRSRPEFPGKWLGVFIGVCVVLFLAQLGAVLAMAELGEEEHVEAAESTEPGATEPEPTEPEPTEPGRTEPAPTEPAPGGEGGDPAAGREVFLGSAGCSTCHTLADAGSTGTIGPDLDAARPSYEKVVAQVRNGGGGMPAFADTLNEQQIADVAAYVSSAAGS